MAALAQLRARLGLDRAPPGTALPPDLVINGDVVRTRRNRLGPSTRSRLARGGRVHAPRLQREGCSPLGVSLRAARAASRALQDATLLRFLKARQGSVDKAHAMLLKCIQWRKENDIARRVAAAAGSRGRRRPPAARAFRGVAPLRVCGPPRCTAWPAAPLAHAAAPDAAPASLARSIFARPLPEAKFQHLTRYFPHAHHGFDKKGQPIYIDCTGQMDVESVLEGVSKEDVLHSHIIMMEYQNRVLMAQGSAKMGSTVHRMCNIVDMTGASSRLASRKAVEIFKLIAAVDQDNYPETMGATYVVNAPWVFTAVWRVVRAFLDDGVTAKVHILGEGAPTRDALLAAVDADQLPTFLGGTCRCPGGCVSGAKCTAPGGLVASQRRIAEFCEEYTHARNARLPLPVPDGAGGLPLAAASAKIAPIATRVPSARLAAAAAKPAPASPRRLDRNYAFRKPADEPPMVEPPAPPPPPPPPPSNDTAAVHAGQPATPVTPSDSERSYDDATAAEAAAEAAAAQALAAAAAAEAAAAREAALDAHAAVVTAAADSHAADREARAAAKLAHFAAEEARAAARLASVAASAVVGSVSATTHAAAAAVARRASYLSSTLRGHHEDGGTHPPAAPLAEESCVFSDAYESLSDEDGS